MVNGRWQHLPDRRSTTAMSAAELARAFLSGRQDPRAAVESYLSRIDALGPANPVFLHVTRERARAEAHASAARYRAATPRGLLDGVPIAWKDVFDVAGVPTTAGSRVRLNAFAKEDAASVRQLCQHGLVTLGKTNMTEFAYSTVGLNPHFGTPANARDPQRERVPGGSSSGSAVAVASGCAPVAMGSDTGGSVRTPASFNGLVGFKPSHGRYCMKGVFPLAPSLDTIGPLARSVEDCRLIDAALRQAPSPPLDDASLTGLELVVPTSYVLEGADDDVAARFEEALARLAAAGVVIHRRPLPSLDMVRQLDQRHGSLIAMEAHATLGHIAEDPAAASAIDPLVRERILAGGRSTIDDRRAIEEGRHSLQAALTDDLRGALFVAPTVVLAPPRIAALGADPDLFRRVNVTLSQNTRIANFLDLPSITIPSGSDDQDMPTGLLLTACNGQDERLLHVAAAVETVLKDAGS